MNAMKRVALLGLLAGAAIVAGFFPDKLLAGYVIFALFVWYAYFDR